MGEHQWRMDDGAERILIAGILDRLDAFEAWSKTVDELNTAIVDTLEVIKVELMRLGIDSDLGRE